MKKILIIILLFCLILLVSIFNTANKLEAMQYDPSIFDGFSTEHVYKCYKETYDSLNQEYNYSWDLYLFIGSYDDGVNYSDRAFILYDYVENDILEYSFSNGNPWNQPANVHDNLIYTINGFHVYTYFDYLSSTGYSYKIVETNQVYDAPLSIISLDYQFYDLGINLSNLNLNGVVTREHTIDNAFYFQNLTSNFGINTNHSCGYVAIGMLLSYFKELYDSRLIPNSINTTINNVPISMNYEDYYNDSIDDEYNISLMESPGSNDLFHNYLIDFGSYEVQNLGYRRYSLDDFTLVDVLYQYLERIYGPSNSFLDIDYRLLTDARFYNNGVYSEQNDFEHDYSYYDSQTSRANIMSINGVNEYEFDILSELDNGYPVILFLGVGFEELYEIENIDGGLIDVDFKTSEGHAVIAYGYKVINGIIYYKCHTGWSRDDVFSTDIYIKKGGSNVGIYCYGVSLRPHSNNMTPNSGYYFEHDNCEINLPTDVIYDDYSSFVRNELVLDSYDSALEYYICPECFEPMCTLSHNFRYSNINTTQHTKYCNCGYSTINNHTSEHYTDLFGHVQHCLLCNSYYRSTSEITNVVISELYHKWTCTLCNSSGISLHDLIFIPINSSFHIRMCSCCSYSEHLSHGVDESEIQYYPIDSTTHMCICDRCGFNWIENHNNHCPCIW